MCTPASREARCGHFRGSPLTKVGAKNSLRTAEAVGSYGGRGPKGSSRLFHSSSATRRSSSTLDQLVDVDGLDQVDVEAGGGRALAIRRLAVAGQRDQGRAATVLRPNAARELVPIQVGQPHVEDAHVRQEAAPAIDGSVAVIGDGGLKPLALQRLGQELGQIDVVVDDEHPDVRPGGRRLRAANDLGRLARDGRRKLDGERRALPASVAVNRHGPAMASHHVVDDRQAQSQAAAQDVARSVALHERLEDPLQLLGRDAGAVVADADPRTIGGALDEDLDAPTGRRELGRVGQQVGEHLYQPRSIALHGQIPRVRHLQRVAVARHER